MEASYAQLGAMLPGLIKELTYQVHTLAGDGEERARQLRKGGR